MKALKPLFAALWCTLTAVAQEPAGNNQWINDLPEQTRSSLLWHADHEEGNLKDWTDSPDPDLAGGGIFNTGKNHEAIAKTNKTRAFQGTFSAQATIANALDGQYGNKAVRLMRWTDKPWDQGGKYLPTEAYYGVWIYLDRNYLVRREDSSGWWNIFQFKSETVSQGSQPMWVVNIGNDPRTGAMQFYLYSHRNRPAAISQKKPIPVPVGRWFHLEAQYRQSTGDATNGAITVWQNGVQILQARDVKTILDKNLVWGIGNYTNHVSGGPRPGSATILFDDATISTRPTHTSVQQFLKTRHEKR